MALVVHHYSYSNTEEDETHTILAAARALVSSDGWTTLRLQEIEVDDERPVDLHDLEDWVPSQGAFWWNTIESPTAAHNDSLAWEDSGEADTGFMVNEDEEEDESEDEATRSRVLLDFSASHGGEESRDQSGDDPSEEADTAFCLDGDDAIDSDDDSDPDNNLLSSVLSGPNKYGSSALFIQDSVVMSQSSTDEAQALLTRLTPSPDVSPTTAARPFTSDYPASPPSQKRPHVKLSFSADDNDNDEVVEDSLLEEGSSYLPSPTDSQTKELPREDAVPTLPRTPAKVAPSRFKSKSPLKPISALLPVGLGRDAEADEESQILDADEFTRLPSPPPRKRKKIDTEDGEYEGDPISEWHGCLSNTSHEVEHSPRGEAAPLQPRRDSIRDFVPHPHAHLASEKAIGVRFFETPSVLPPPSDLPPCFYPFPPSPPVSPYTPIGDIGHDYWASKKSLLAPPDDTLGTSAVCIFIPIPQDAIPFPPADTDDSVSLIVAFWKELRRMHQELDLSVFVTTRYDATGCPEIPLDDPFWLEEEAQPHLADRLRREAEKDKPKPEGEGEGEEGLQVFCLAPFRFIVKDRILASWKSRLDGASRGRLTMKLRGPVEGEDIDEEGWA